MELRNKVEEYYEANYTGAKTKINVSMNRKLWLDFQSLALELSRKTKRKVTASGLLSRIMVQEILENKKYE